MKQIIFVLFTACALFLSGCIEQQDNETGQTCTVEKFCENGLESVCGEDGVTYACPALALCEGVEVDQSGEACTESLQCPVIQCEADCPNGFKQDAQGCDTCECKEAPAETCGDDACVPFYCGSSRGQCIRESELATIGNCPAGPFNEPEPQCGCTGEECAAVICEADADCGDGLCVRTPEEDRPGYCVDATCDDIAEIYQNPRPEQVSCQQDDECMVVASLPNCCGAHFVNEEGAEVIGQIDEFAARTSCGQQWADFCAVVDCAPLEGEPKCVQGTCQLVAE